ncbi:MAG: pseudouridine synthase [Candidatus Krumholzibacteriota bacterium]|nr:pseudouridine synthase [Candidatus Krumholzibacteriota bacterium]
MRDNFPQRIKVGVTQLRVLYEDNHLLGVYKPGGVLVQGDNTRDETLMDLAKAYLKTKYDKPGNVFLGLVHRLDRPVSGVVLYARTSKAASRLTREFATREVEKTYFAVVYGEPAEEKGDLVSYIERAHRRSRVSGPENDRAKEALLTYRLLARSSGLSLLEIVPKTGRHHQIRLQLAGISLPVVGDVKYGAPGVLPDKTIALHAGILEVKHPTRDERVRLSAAPPANHPWSLFRTTIDSRFE